MTAGHWPALGSPYETGVWAIAERFNRRYSGASGRIMRFL